MNPIWEAIMAAVGLFMLVSGITRSNFVVYRPLVARSRGLWGKNVLSLPFSSLWQSRGR